MGDTSSAGLNDIIVITVQNLEDLDKRAKCPPKPPGQDCKPVDIALFLNGRQVKGLPPESVELKIDDKTSNGKLSYHLRRVTDAAYAADAKEQWGDLLGLSYNDFLQFKRPVEVSVGLPNGDPILTDVKLHPQSQAEIANQFYLIRVRTWRLVIWLALLALMLYWFLRKAWYSDLLRDRAPVYWPNQKPYSLSACQAAWWFLLIIVSFVFIWLVTGQYDLSETALVLIGVGFGTALGATVIDNNKRGKPAETQTDSDGLQPLLAETQQLGRELTQLKVELTRLEKAEVKDAAAIQQKSAAVEQKKKDYDAKVKELKEKFPNAIGPGHEGFLTDILSDANGISFHRFQMAVWTLVLGIFFVVQALGRLAMPEFDQTLLALMGISAATYVGFKIPENNSAPLPPEKPAPPPGNPPKPPGQ
jgi:hypothetical protein